MVDNNKQGKAPRDEAMDILGFLILGLFVAFLIAQCATP